MQPLPLSLDFENTKIYVICLTCTLELLQVPTDIHCGKRTLLRQREQSYPSPQGISTAVLTLFYYMGTPQLELPFTFHLVCSSSARF